MTDWRDKVDAAIDALLAWSVYRPLCPMVGAGAASIPLMFLGVWLRWDWLACAGLVIGYGCVAWALCAFLFLLILLAMER
jgi:hypothetical protein